MRLRELKGKNEREVAAYLAIEGRDALVEKFAALGLPDKKEEAYRYADIEKLFEPLYKRVDRLAKDPEIGEAIEITDGVVTKAPKGVRVYYEACDKVDEEHFDPLYYLSHLLSPKVIKIELDGDTETEIVHRITCSETLIAYRVVLFNQANRHATLYERYETEGDTTGSLVLWGYDAHIAPDSSLRLIKSQTIDEESYAMIASHSIRLERNAHMAFKSFDMGAAHALQLLNVILEERAEFDAGHLLYIGDSARRGTVSKIIHRGAHTHSHQEAKNILEDKARGIFDALIKVEHSGKYSVAHQNSKAILLNDGAYMAAKPQLEIYIDELEASHGSTTGQLDAKQLFYLRSRGIAEVEARKMLVLAFANTLIERIKDARAQERIKAEFEAAFYRRHKG